MIDSNGKWWRGNSFEDLAKYMKLLYKQDTRRGLKKILQSECKCGNIWFILDYEQNEGIAKRICSKCKEESFICDSGEYWDDAIKDSKPKRLKCVECKNLEHEIGVGFEYYEDDKEIRWIVIGTRCKKCNILSSPIDWQIDYAPSKHLEKQI